MARTWNASPRARRGNAARYKAGAYREIGGGRCYSYLFGLDRAPVAETGRALARRLDQDYLFSIGDETEALQDGDRCSVAFSHKRLDAGHSQKRGGSRHDGCSSFLHDAAVSKRSAKPVAETRGAPFDHSHPDPPEEALAQPIDDCKVNGLASGDQILRAATRSAPAARTSDFGQVERLAATSSVTNGAVDSTSCSVTRRSNRRRVRSGDGGTIPSSHDRHPIEVDSQPSRAKERWYGKH